MLSDAQDAFGHEFLDHLAGKDTYEIIERDDGMFGTGLGTKLYFAEYKEWPAGDKLAMTCVRGKVLGIGCGVGRHSLHLQEQGFDVHGIDVSPGAVEVCKRRGLAKVTLLPLTQLSRELGVFDTVLMMGNNVGLLGNPRRRGGFSGGSRA